MSYVLPVFDRLRRSSREISLELHVVFISSTLQIKRAKRQERVRERKKIESVEFFFSYVRIPGHIVRTKVIKYSFFFDVETKKAKMK